MVKRRISKTFCTFSPLGQGVFSAPQQNHHHHGKPIRGGLKNAPRIFALSVSCISKSQYLPCGSMVFTWVWKRRFGCRRGNWNPVARMIPCMFLFVLYKKTQKTYNISVYLPWSCFWGQYVRKHIRGCLKMRRAGREVCLRSLFRGYVSGVCFAQFFYLTQFKFKGLFRGLFRRSVSRYVSGVCFAKVELPSLILKVALPPPQKKKQ